MLEADSTMLLIIDVQDRLYRVTHGKEALAGAIEKLIRGTRIFGIPLIVTEQYPRGIGPTIPEIAALLDGVPVISKMSFNCLSEPAFLEAFRNINRRQVLIAGIESHVCVYQTTVDLLDRGYEVQIVADGVSSRTAWSRDLGIQRMRDEGAKITSAEMILFELVKTAAADKFREISQIIK